MKNEPENNFRLIISIFSFVFVILFSTMFYVTHTSHPFSFLLSTDTYDVNYQLDTYDASQQIHTKVGTDEPIPNTISQYDKNNHTKTPVNNGSFENRYYDENVKQLTLSSTTSKPNIWNNRINQPTTKVIGSSDFIGRSNSASNSSSGSNNSSHTLTKIDDSRNTVLLADNRGIEQPPFITIQGKGSASKPTCDDVVTSQMHNKYNYNILQNMGCNPTFTY